MLLMATMAVMQSCDDDDDSYSLGDFTISMATVKVINAGTYYLQLDNNKTVWPGATSIPWYNAIDGQRVIADYTILGDHFQEYDYVAKINSLYNVLTKGVEDLTAENEAFYGNDKVNITDMRIGGNYLNVRFRINIPANTKHRVSLVRNTTVESPQDNYIHLEYRYNDQDDVTNYIQTGYVSFNLGELGPASGYKGLKIKINSAINGEKEIVRDFPAQGQLYLQSITDEENFIEQNKIK